jgi:hypothetical protein
MEVFQIYAIDFLSGISFWSLFGAQFIEKHDILL